MLFLQKAHILNLDKDVDAWSNFCASIPDENFSTMGINKILKEQYHGIFRASHYDRSVRFETAEDMMHFILTWS